MIKPLKYFSIDEMNEVFILAKQFDYSTLVWKKELEHKCELAKGKYFLEIKLGEFNLKVSRYVYDDAENTTIKIKKENEKSHVRFPHISQFKKCKREFSTYLKSILPPIAE